MALKERQCSIETNSLNQKIQLYKYLLSLEQKKVSIKDLNPTFTPLEIGSRIGILIEEGLIEVDWEKKVIYLDNLEIEPLLKSKNKLGTYTRKVPEYMKVEKQELNKPYNKVKKK